MKHVLYITLGLHAFFVVLYVWVVGWHYESILRMMEANSAVDDVWLHFFRWPWLGALVYGLPMALAGIMAACVASLLKWRRYIALSLCIPLLCAYRFAPKASQEGSAFRLFSSDMEAEKQVCTYMLLADDGKWEKLIETVHEYDAVDTPLGMRYCLLAESALGRLPDALFRYHVQSPDDLLFRGSREPVICQFNRQFYANLGVYDEAFHQAMEYGLRQNDGMCLSTLRQLTDYALSTGDWRVAQKYLSVLDKSWLQGGFVKERTQRLEEVKRMQQRAVAENDSTVLAPLRADNFVGLYPLRSEMVRLAYYGVGDQQKALDYLLCCTLLEKDLDTFYKVLTQFPNYQHRPLPANYQQALDILQSQGQAWRDVPYGNYAFYFYNVRNG